MVNKQHSQYKKYPANRCRNLFIFFEYKSPLPKYKIPTHFMVRLSIVSLASKATVTVTQLAATSLVILLLTPVEQGYYYSFLALVAVQAIFELGLSQVLVVFLSYESAILNRNSLDEYRPNRRARAIASASLQQYLRLTILFIFSVGIVGTLFFRFTHGGNLPDESNTHWGIPWWILVLFSGLRLPLIWLESIIEGMGELRHVMLTRILAHVSWLIVFFLALHNSLGLFAPTLAAFALLAVSMIAYWPYRRMIRRLTHQHAQQARRIDWKGEVAPMQRRVSGTWFASYIISNTSIPVSFAMLGAAEAGRAGVAFQVAAAIGVIAGAIVSPKISIASRLIAGRLFREFRILLLRTLRLTMSTGTITAILGIALLIVIPIAAPTFASRLPTVVEVLPLLVAALINCLMSCVAVFSRAQKKELFTTPLILVALITTGGSLAAQGAGGILVISCLHAFGALCVTLPYSIWAFRETIRR